MWDGPELGNASLKQILIQILSRWERTGRRGRKLTAIFMSALDLGLHLTGKDMQPAQLPITGTNTSTGIDCMSGHTKNAPIKHKPALCGRYEVNVPRSHWIIIKKTKNRHVQIIQSKILLRSHDWISSQVRVELIFEHIEETANHSTNEEIHGRTCWHLRTIHEHNYERRHCEKGVGKKDVELGGSLNENLKKRQKMKTELEENYLREKMIITLALWTKKTRHFTISVGCGEKRNLAFTTMGKETASAFTIFHW
jgi:hypothetical protein